MIAALRSSTAMLTIKGVCSFERFCQSSRAGIAHAEAMAANWEPLMSEGPVANLHYWLDHPIEIFEELSKEIMIEAKRRAREGEPVAAAAAFSTKAKETLLHLLRDYAGRIAAGAT